MATHTACPTLADYQRLATGQLADAERETLLEHLEGCDTCAQKFSRAPRPDKLINLIHGARVVPSGASEEAIARLIDGLSKLRPGETSAEAVQTQGPREALPVLPLQFACPACGRSLKVPGACAGQKVQCPLCLKVVLAPAGAPVTQVPALSSGNLAAGKSVPPEPRSRQGAGPQEGPNAAGRSANTVDHQPASALNKEMCDCLAPPQAADELGRLGPYRVLEVLGAGGMGVVFRAEDPQLARPVALKAMLPGLAASKSARERFLREARAAAAIKHDHIVAIYQVGEDRGVSFLAMELLEGEPLEARLQREGKLTTAEVLRIGREIALGLAAAHKRQLIHRDIKPANIWLEADTSRAKLLDFGLARAIGDEAHITQKGAIVGTPAYMAPEQAQGKGVDPRSDLFSLGCVLYRMATGALPFQGTDLVSTLMAVSTHNPPSPLELEPGLSPGLSAFIMSLLAKEAGNRPPTAQGVAEALERHARAPAPRDSQISKSSAPAAVTPAPILKPLATKARQDQPSTGKRARKWWRAVGLGIALLTVMIGLWAGGVIRVRTPDGVLLIDVNEPNSEVFVDGKQVTVTWDEGGKKAEIHIKPGTHKIEVKKDGFTVHGDDVVVKDGERRVFTATFQQSQPARPVKGADEPTPTADGFVPLFNGKDLTGWKTHEKNPGDWTVEGGILIGRGPPSYLFSERGDYKNFIYRVEAKINEGGNSGQYFRTEFGPGDPKGYEAQINSTYRDSQKTGSLYGIVKITDQLHKPDEWFIQEVTAIGEHIVIKVNDKVVVDTNNDKFAKGHFAIQQHHHGSVVQIRKIEIKELPPAKTETAPPKPAPPPLPPPLKVVPPPPPSAALEALRRDQLPPEALKMAGDGDPSKAPASLVGVLGEAQPIHSQRVAGLTFSPDNRWLASGSYDKSILLWDMVTCRVHRVLQGHTGPVSSVAFSKEGRTIVSASHDGTLKLWPVDKEAEPETLEPKLGEILALAASPDGRFLTAVGSNRGIKLWKWGQWDKPLALAALSGDVGNAGKRAPLAFSPDGELLACGGWGAEGRIGLYQTSDGKLLRSWEADKTPLSRKGSRIFELAFHRDGQWLASAGGDPPVKLWDVSSGKFVAEYGNFTSCHGLTFHPDGKTLYACLAGSFSYVFDLPAMTIGNQFLEPNGIGSAAHSPDGKLLALGTDNGGVHVLDTTKWERQFSKDTPSHYITALAVGPDGRTVISGGDDNALRRWDVARPKESQILHQFDCPLYHVSVSPDGKKFATAAAFAWYDAGRRGEVWDAATGKRLFRVDPPAKGLPGIAFSPDGKLFAGYSHGENASVHLWDANNGKEIHRFPNIGDGCLDRPAFSADGKLLAAATHQTKTVKVWDVASGEEVHCWEDVPMCAVALSPDGRLLAAGHFDGTISLWDLSAKVRKKRTLGGHAARVNVLRFTPDGKTLVSSSDDGTIRLWDPERQRSLRELIQLGPAKRRLVIELDPSGKYLFAAGDSPLIYVLRLPGGEDQTSVGKEGKPLAAGPLPHRSGWIEENGLREVADLPAA